MGARIFTWHWQESVGNEHRPWGLVTSFRISLLLPRTFSRPLLHVKAQYAIVVLHQNHLIYQTNSMQLS
jgi:hypothetical protein